MKQELQLYLIQLQLFSASLSNGKCNIYGAKYAVNCISAGTVIKESSVVAETIMAAYSFSLSKLSARMDVMADAGMAVMTITELTALELSFKRRENMYMINGMATSFNAIP